MKLVIFYTAMTVMVLGGRNKKPDKSVKSIATTPVKSGRLLKSKEDKFSYFMGYDASRNLKRIGVKLNVSLFAAGAKDGNEGKPSRVSKEEAKKIIQDFMVRSRKAMGQKTPMKPGNIKTATANKTAAKKFLANNRTKKGVVTTASGLQYKILRRGKGAKPKITDKVECHYKGTLLDGKKFDSSYDRKKAAKFSLMRVVKGWQEGIPLMKVGAKFKFWIPGKLAYGMNPRPGGLIGPMALLIFEVELIGIVKN